MIDDEGNTDATPYNFMDRIEEDLYLKAKWIKVGKYSFVYNPTMGTTGITGDMARYNDPLESDRYYVDGASAVVLQAPTNIRVDEQPNTGGFGGNTHEIDPNEYVFRGWRIVDQDGKPMENNVFYNPGDTIIVNYAYALGPENVIHMEAFYEKRESTVRRVDFTSLTLKKLTALALSAAVIALSAISAGAAGSYFLSEGFYYGVADQNAYVHGYQGTESDVVIREKFLSYDVTAVESFAFFRNETIQTLSLYDATRLNSLGQCAFAGCVNLKAVEIPSAVQTLGNSVFDGCTSLYEVRFRDGSAAQIPAQAFFECASLETVLFENDVTSIGNRAFSGCTSLEYVEIPKSVTTIAASAFDNCPALTLGVWYGSCAYDYAKQNHIPYVLLDGVSLVDANGDGYVNINDVTAIQRHLSELEALQGICLLAADVNQNGTQEIDDATHLQAYLAEYDIPDPIGEVITQ